MIKNLINNSGYFPNKTNKLNKLSKSTCIAKYFDQLRIILLVILKKMKNLNLIIKNGLKISKKNIIFEANYWKISGFTRWLL